MRQTVTSSPGISRRKFLRSGAIGAAAVASSTAWWPRSAKGLVIPSSAASRIVPLNRNWLFGGKFSDAAIAAQFDDSSFRRVTLPHCVADLSWRKWNPASWQDIWVYRKHFRTPPDFAGKRVFLNFDAVMLGVTPVLNGHELPQHLGGYLPARYEITNLLNPSAENALAVVVDSRWRKDVPPEGTPKGSPGLDYLEAGGIVRPVHLCAVPQIFISDVFAKPVSVLDAARRVETLVTIDAGAIPSALITLQVELRDGQRTIAREQKSLAIEKAGQTEVALTLANLGNVALWDVDAPRLYNVVATLLSGGNPTHEQGARIGFREARFEADGFFLNGRRFRLFGLDRHEIYPYVGGAMPPRVMRRDAEILRREFNCNIVRCSHYPQSAAFLDACDELGLMVWEETPGWGFLGGDAWKERVVENVTDMILRDRNRPSIIIWGVRVNESANDEALYYRTTDVARKLDGSRPCSGSMTSGSRKDWKGRWHEDVFAMDDYHANPDGTVGIDAPLPGVPYMLAETVGQFNYTARKGFTAKYRRAADIPLQETQALRHAQAHNKAASYPRFAGVIGWCAFDYSSEMNSYENIKCPGVADVFRIPKLGASFYQTQTESSAKPIILPNFYWDFGPATPQGPGKDAAIFSNCDRLEIFIDGKHLSTLSPDRANYPNLKHPPFFVDLELDGAHHPELRIEGYTSGKRVLTRRFSSDPAHDRFQIQADDTALVGDGSDATRLVFARVDKYGAPRALGDGDVSFKLRGPGTLVGDNPFALADAGGMGAVWVKAAGGGAGNIQITATHTKLGAKSLKIRVTRADAG